MVTLDLISSNKLFNSGECPSGNLNNSGKCPNENSHDHVEVIPQISQSYSPIHDVPVDQLPS